MIDLHCHLLPGIDDGPADIETALAMAEAQVRDGVTVVVCTPHITPGVYNNKGPQIRVAVHNLSLTLALEGHALEIVAGADNHVVPDQASRLRSGEMLTLANSRYVLIEPPHHVAPQRLDELFFALQLSGYVPILTHPERLSWIAGHYEMILRLARAGVWMQITAGSLAGTFGRGPRYWAERMLDEGIVHVLATDAHNMDRRPPNLSLGRDLAARRIGEAAAYDLVATRPLGVIEDRDPSQLPPPVGMSVAPRAPAAAAPARSEGTWRRGLRRVRA